MGKVTSNSVVAARAAGIVMFAANGAVRAEEPAATLAIYVNGVCTHSSSTGRLIGAVFALVR
jgi:hypothetical protein